jgi:alpha-beta hydrolase superfamily lysophospholipase
MARRLAIVWSQQELHRRTLAGRLIAHHGRRLLRAIAIIGLAVAVCLVIGIALAEQALHPVPRRAGPGDRDAATRAARAAGATLSDVPLVARDGALLRAWSFERPERGRGTVLLLHGLGDTRASQLPLATLLLEHHYHVLAPDSRVHGDSGGTLASYGLAERTDLLAWTAWIRARRPDECVFAAGASMGAAIVLLAAATEPFCAVIAEAPYATFRGAAGVRVGRQFGLPPPIGPIAATPFVEAALVYTRLRYGLPIGRANPIDAVRTTRVPVLVIEDGDDDRMPAGDAARLAAANPRLVTVWHVAGARHVRTWAAEPDEYPRRVLAFLAAHQ